MLTKTNNITNFVNQKIHIMESVFSKRLKSARLMKGLSMDELCERINHLVSKQSISKYEKGMMMPDSTVLIALSKALEVNIDFFFRPYKTSFENIEFRKKSKLRISVQNSIKEKVSDEIERYMEIEDLLDVENHYIARYKEIVIQKKDDVFHLVRQLRKDWKIGEDAISNITFLLEENGIKVIYLDAEPGFDGLSGVVNQSKPFIIVNKNANSERQRFTALHELGHLILNIPDELPDKEKEKLCNVFANEMLIPTSELIHLLGEARKDISLQELIPIQSQYGISIDALMYKAKECGIISEQRYKGYCIKKNQSTSFEMQTQQSLYPHENSSRFASLVYRAVSQEIISISKAAALLNISVHDVRSNLSLI